MNTRSEKILHWVRQNNAPAWERWMATEEGQARLKNKSEVMEWVKFAWRVQSVEILFDLDRRQASLLPCDVDNSPLWILDVLSKRKELDYSGTLSALVEKALEEALQKGWSPTARWAKSALAVCQEKTGEYSSKIVECFKKIHPKDEYDAIPSAGRSMVLNDERGDGVVRWMDLIGGKAGRWTKEVWDHAFLEMWAKEFAEMDVNWVDWAFKSGSEVIKLDRVLRGLERGVLKAEVTDEQLVRIEKRYKEVAYRYASEPDGPRDRSGAWRTWCESKRLRAEHGINEQTVGSERKRSAL